MYGEAFPKEVPTHFPSSRLARALSRDPALPKAPDQNLCRADIKGELEFVWERYERVDMLSYLCPNLEEFEVSTAERNNIWFSVAPGSLMRLTHLSLSDLGPGLTQKFAQLCQIAAVAPNLRSLVCYRVSQAMRFISEPNTFARLTELRFYHANISARALRHFLAACPELRSFTYIASGYSAGIVEAKPSAIQDAIIRHAPNLVFLSLYLWRYSVENIQNESDSGAEDQVVDSSPLNTSTKMTSFARLSKLEHLALDTRCILPDPVMTSPGQGDNSDSMFLLRLLPPSIRSLRLAGSPSNVPAVFPSCGVGPLRAALVRLVSVVPDKFPMLKEVMLEALGKEEFRDVRVLFEKQGVVVELESAHEVCEHWIYK
ncbi:hypothetical protein N0V88_008103 [Collariella sp. IMI 366227]|nr:hypothetical protein N0V88_008103 [Collariella sp. IMI 366227]